MSQAQRVVDLQHRATKAHGSLKSILTVVKNCSAVLAGVATIISALIELCGLINKPEKEKE